MNEGHALQPMRHLQAASNGWGTRWREAACHDQPVAGLLRAILLGLLAWLIMQQTAQSQTPAGVSPGHALVIPLFIDPARRLEWRERQRPPRIRFVTEDDYPPFHYLAPDGQLAGFNVDLARAVCTELAAICTIQVRRWDRLLPSLDTNESDAVIASHRIDAELRRKHDVSSVIYRVPARFAGRQGAMPASTEIDALAGKRVAVVGGSAHEAFLNALFPRLELLRVPAIERGLEAMRRGEADLAFGDGVAIAFWLNGSESLGCCAFLGGPYTESRFFGEGSAIVMRKGATDLRNAIDFALWRIARDGRFAKLYLKHFPVSFY